MKSQLMQILVCPVDKAQLTLTVTTESDGEILEGNLRCSKCGEKYLIQDGIPNLLPPDMRD